MAKESGLGMVVAVDDDGGSARTISNDVQSVAFATPQALIDVTGVDKSALERLIGLADGSVSMTGTFNAASNQQHDVFKNVGTTSVARTVAITISGQILSMEILFTEYVVARGADGALTWTVAGQLASGTVPAWTT